MGAFSVVGRECGCLFSGRVGLREPFQWSGVSVGAFSMVGRECGSPFSGLAGIRIILDLKPCCSKAMMY